MYTLHSQHDNTSSTQTRAFLAHSKQNSSMALFLDSEQPDSAANKVPYLHTAFKSTYST